MVQRAGIFSLICVIFCVVIISIEAGIWTGWRGITMCDAKPCNCSGETVDSQSCEKGTRYELRGCIVGSDGKACQYDNEGGPIRKAGCTNIGVCPGWSAYENASNCESHGERIMARYCNNPAPIHSEIKCVKSSEGVEGAGEVADDGIEEKNINCTYVAPTTTTTTAASTTTAEDLPCCQPVTTAAGPTTTSDPDSSDDYYDYGSLFCDPNKRCEGEESDEDYYGEEYEE